MQSVPYTTRNEKFCAYIAPMTEVELAQFAMDCGAKTWYFWNQLRTGNGRPSLDLAILIEAHSKGKVPVQSWPPRKARKGSKGQKPRSKRVRVAEVAEGAVTTTG